MQYRIPAYLITALGALVVVFWLASSHYRLSWPAATAPVNSFRFGDVTYYTYTPNLPAGMGPAATVVVLSGLGGDPGSYIRQFIPYAEQYHWTLLAPVFAHKQGSTFDEDAQIWHSLHQEVASLGAGKEKVLLYGFSRGSQTAHRFALCYPDHILAAALMSAGTYTLPDETLDLPWGVKNLPTYSGVPFDAEALARVPFSVGVGDKDNVAADVSRDWDKYIGKTRLERAQAFASALEAMGARVEFQVFPGQGHEETPTSLDQAMAFLHTAAQAAQRGSRQ